MIIILMGVSGTGKSTIGRGLQEQLHWPFYDADDFHPKHNIEKMASGQPLNDADRAPWLETLNQHLQQLQQQQRSAILACSALKRSYRDTLAKTIKEIVFVHLTGSFELLFQRLSKRKNHFMSADMLQSQFDTLEPCPSAYEVDVIETPQTLVDNIIEHYQLIPEYHSSVLLSGLMFPEAPRWHHNKFWFTDQHAQQIICCDLDGKHQVIAQCDDRLGGLGWLPEGDLLVVYMTQKKVFRLHEQELHLYADLSDLASFYCNDLVVDALGNAWVGNFGYDLDNDAPVRPAELIHIPYKGQPEIVADDVIFPNGCLIDEVHDSMLLAETFANRIRYFHIENNGHLSQQSIWADLSDGHPDGLCFAGNGDIWVALPNQKQLVRVTKGGQIVARVITQKIPYACVLAGEQQDRLLITCSATSDPEEAKKQKSGQIEILLLTE